MSRRHEAARLDLDAVDLERITWLCAVLGALRRRVDESRPMAAWRARVPRPFALEALLGALDPTAPTVETGQVARALGVSKVRTRSLLRLAARVGVIAEVPAAPAETTGWALTARGRVLRGELEAAQAAALRDVARGTDPEVWAALWRTLEGPPAARRASSEADGRSRVQSGAPSD